MDIEYKNKRYFAFLEEEYEFSYSEGVFSNPDVEVTIEVSGFTAGVLSFVDVYIWLRDKPKCTRTSLIWIAEYFGFHMNLVESESRLDSNYQIMSSFFKANADRILQTNGEWVLPTMKIHFNWMFNDLFRKNIKSMLSGPSIMEMYNYIKSMDPNWDPSERLAN